MDYRLIVDSILLIFIAEGVGRGARKCFRIIKSNHMKQYLSYFLIVFFFTAFGYTLFVFILSRFISERI